MRPLIILHGAWHQPAHYDDIAERFRAAEVHVEVPDLSGLSLADTTGRVQTLVDAAAQPPVVLAHSFGGLTACGVTGASHLVFLTGFVLDVGETPQGWIERIARETGRPGAPLAMTVDPDGRGVLDPEQAVAGLYADCSPEVAGRAVGLLRPEPLSIFTESPSRASWRDTPSTCVAGSHDRAIAPEMVAAFGERCGTVVTLPTSHSPYLSRPDEVAGLVLAHL